MGGRDSKQYFALSILCICRSASSRFKEQHKPTRAVQPSTSRTIEVELLAPLAGHMWRIASMTRSTISQGSLSEFPVRPAPRRNGIRTHRQNRFICRHSISLTRAACFESQRERTPVPIISRFTQKDDRFRVAKDDRKASPTGRNGMFRIVEADRSDIIAY